MSDPEVSEDKRFADTVRRKAERMERSRREGSSFWRVVGLVGALGWQFALPVVGCTLLAFALGSAIGSDAVVLVGIVTGVAIGIWLVVRAVGQALEEE